MRVRNATARGIRGGVLALAAGAMMIPLTAASGQKPDAQMSNMPGMDMSGKGAGGAKTAGSDADSMRDMADMKNMGPSMAAMAGHMAMTPRRPVEPGDEERAKAVVATAKATMERYKDYKKAVADGYVMANPTVDQPQFHFNNDANAKLADTQFDPAKPTALLYRRTPSQRFKLEGVMYTARPDATADELNQRIPLSVARWHEHVNFCGAPADKVQEYHGDHPKFGMFGSIRTKEACDAEHGTFLPYVFTWMIHVFPYEGNEKDVFSMNDDVAHVH